MPQPATSSRTWKPCCTLLTGCSLDWPRCLQAALQVQSHKPCRYMFCCMKHQMIYVVTLIPCPLFCPFDLSLSYELTHIRKVCCMLLGDLPVNLLDLSVSRPVPCPLACLSTCLSADLGCAHWLASQFAYQLTGPFPVGGCLGLPSASCLPCNPPVDLKKKRKRKDNIFRCQFNEKPSIIPGCPGQLICSRCVLRRFVSPSTSL